MEYRKDGWPLCPRCGEDELASTLFPAQPKPIDPMKCLYCGWRGEIPAMPPKVVDNMRADK